MNANDPSVSFTGSGHASKPPSHIQYCSKGQAGNQNWDQNIGSSIADTCGSKRPSSLLWQGSQMLSLQGGDEVYNARKYIDNSTRFRPIRSNTTTCLASTRNPEDRGVITSPRLHWMEVGGANYNSAQARGKPSLEVYPQTLRLDRRAWCPGYWHGRSRLLYQKEESAIPGVPPPWWSSSSARVGVEVVKLGSQEMARLVTSLPGQMSSV